MYSQTMEESIWIPNHAVGKVRVVWPRSGSDILKESTTISETKPSAVVSKENPKKETSHILDNYNVAVGVYGAHRLGGYEDKLSAY